MWLKEGLIVQLILLQNTISSQPLIENENNRESRQTRYEECCPCPEVSDNVNYRDQDLIPSQKSSFLRMPLDECPCRSGSDNEGSPSIFYPSFLRGAQPVDRSQEVKQELKPLLRPEVGLASSVLETLKEATDEEYKEALLRDATRTALKAAEPVLLDTEPGSTKHSVTIVINPRDLDNGNDAIPEASHVHETRCIHSPLRSSNYENSGRMALPRLSKEYLLLPKRKFREPLHKKLFDMDNSPSNIQENFDVLDKNDLGNKLKINPSLLSGLSGKINELRNSWGNSGTKLRMIPEQCDDLNSQAKLNSSPMLTLAAFKNKLRDLSEMRSPKRLNNNLLDLHQNQFKAVDAKRDDEIKKTAILKLPTFDKGVDKHIPLVKNIFKLRDVELLPPRKTNIEDVSETKNKELDLKSAGTENKADTVRSSKIPTAKYNNECDIVDHSFSETNTDMEEPQEAESKSITSGIYTLPGSQKDHEVASINDSSSNIIKSTCDETEMLDNSAESLKYNVKTDFQNVNFNSDDHELTKITADENIDLEPESTNILQQVDQEDESTQNDYLSGEADDSDEDDCDSERLLTVSPINFPTNKDENGKLQSLPVARESNQRLSLKDDILRKLENLRNTVKTKFAETQFDNIKNTQLTTSTSASIIALNENPVETKDLQQLSDSLLNQDILSRTKSATKKTECAINYMNSENTLSNNESYETTQVNNKESSSELLEKNSQISVTEVPTENILKLNFIDRVNTTLNPSKQNDLSKLQIQEKTCSTVSNESYEAVDEDISTKNEMSSQASNVKYNALRPQFTENYLRSSLPQDFEVQPTLKEKDSKKSFEVPSLEEIRQSITNIIDAGEREEEDLGSIDHDPLNESSNINLVRLSDTNLAKLPNIGHSSLPSFQRNSLGQRLNLNSQKNKLGLQDVASLKPLNLPSMQNNRAGIFGDYLFSGKDKIKPLSISKSALNLLGSPIKETPTLDKIRDSLNTNTNNLFREVPFRLQQHPISNTDSHSLNSFKNGLKSYADNSAKRVQSDISDIKVRNKGTLSKSKMDPNNIFETIARRREDMKEKLQALHIDFNDRFATIHDRLLDQTNLPSMHMPSYKENSNFINLPVTECEQENNYNWVSERQAHDEPYQFLRSKFSSKQDQKFKSAIDSKTFFTSKHNDDHGFKMKHNAKLSNSNPPLNVKKLLSHKSEKIEAQRSSLEKQLGHKPPSNGFKISFSSSTVTPVTKLKTATPNYVKKFPLSVLKHNNNHEKQNTIHSKLKPITNAYRTRMHNYEDANNSPSEPIPLKIQSTEKSPLVTTTMHNNKPTLGSKNAIPKNALDARNTHLVKSVAPLANENQFIANIREALRSRLANITPAKLTSAKDDPIFLDALESPSETLKTIEPTNPLKENTSYKCTMMCVREK